MPAGHNPLASGEQKFQITHVSSKKFVRPKDGALKNDTLLVLHELSADDTWFIFEKAEKPSYSYIKHVASGKYIHPKGGWNRPWNNNKLVIYEKKHDACRFRAL
jgi:hypothetical protein